MFIAQRRSLFPYPSARRQLTLQDHDGHGTSASHGVPRFCFSYIYPWRDGQTELTCEACSIPKWFTRLLTVARPSTNWAQFIMTSDSKPL